MIDIRNTLLSLMLVLSACGAQSGNSPQSVAPANAPPLKLASWNMEFLAEQNGAGCEPRTDEDYAAMRRIVDQLDADVVAFQEVENLAAAERVFDPTRYEVVMETRPGAPSGTCGGKNISQSVIRQAVGFAIRKGISFERHADVTSLMLGNAQLRSGVDITLKAPGRAAIRLLSVHLKSGCFSGNEANACSVLMQQVPMLEAWIDAVAARPERFAILGDWNRRLGLSGDAAWSEIDDGEPLNARLRLADANIRPACDPRYDSFIDHIVLDKRAGADMIQFSETQYASGEKHYSDHCPVAVTIAR